LIRIENLWFKYSEGRKWILKNINFRVNRGEFVVIVGPNGSGKSTLIRILAGLVPKFYHGEIKGNVIVGNINVLRKPEEVFKVAGFLFEDPEVQLVTTTVRDEVSFGPSNLGLNKDEIEKRVKWALEVVRGKILEERSNFELSLGEMQKVVLASILSLKPKVLVLDEPSVFLEAKTVSELYTILKDLAVNEHVTILAVEHDLNKVIEYADKLIVLDEGEIIWQGKPEDLTVDMMQMLPMPQLELIDLVKRLRNMNEHVLKESIVKLHEIVEYISPKTMNLRFFKEHCETEIHNENPRDTIVEMENVWFKYPRTLTYAIKNINLKISLGDSIGILGPNGSGKSTLIKMMVGILKPTHGSIRVLGVKPFKSRSKVAGKIGYVPQNPTLTFTSPTVFSEVYNVAKRLNVPNAAGSAEKVLKTMGLTEYRDYKVLKLSYGLRRRLSIATAIVGKPRLLILDEPTTYLDYRSKRKLIKTLERIKKNTTLIIASQDLDLIVKLCNKIALLANGSIIAYGETRKLVYSENIKDLGIEEPLVIKLSKKFFKNIKYGPLTIEEFEKAMVK